ncbi:MAG: hypothetical protein ACI81P_001710 [Neolewinella sp.]|jgi:hypothetical protein
MGFLSEEQELFIVFELAAFSPTIAAELTCLMRWSFSGAANEVGVYAERSRSAGSKKVSGGKEGVPDEPSRLVVFTTVTVSTGPKSHWFRKSDRFLPIKSSLLISFSRSLPLMAMASNSYR